MRPTPSMSVVFMIFVAPIWALDAKTLALVRLAGLIALESAPASYSAASEVALAIGCDLGLPGDR